MHTTLRARGASRKLPLIRALAVSASLAVSACLDSSVGLGSNIGFSLQRQPYFRIEVIDQSTGRGIPAVTLRTPDQRTYITDSAGVIAFLEPDLMGKRVFFEVESFGYSIDPPRPLLPPGSFLQPIAGGSARLSMLRRNVAERLYRITGSGIERARMLLGERTSRENRSAPSDPLLGTDSAQCIGFEGSLFWIFGDTKTAADPLANYRATGARSPYPADTGWDPRKGVPLDYLIEESGQAAHAFRLRPMVADPYPVIWLSALRVWSNPSGEEELRATYSKVTPNLEVRESGLAVFEPEIGQFVPRTRYLENAERIPSGHTFRYSDSGGAYIVYDLALRSRLPGTRMASSGEEAFEAFTALRPDPSTRGSTQSSARGRTRAAAQTSTQERSTADALERDADGRLVWGWKPNASPITPELWTRLVEAGDAKPREAWYRLIDIDDGHEIVPHHGSVRWNPHRGRWVMIRSELGGSSLLGEVYYAEADTPLGPWAYAKRVATHTPEPASAPARPGERSSRGDMSFYNPVHCAELDLAGGRQIFFQGTLSTFLTDSAAIPSYDYNQLMYALDLEDPRLFLPVAIYRTHSPGSAGVHYRRFEELRTRGETQDAHPSPTVTELAFFAPDRPLAGTIPIFESVDPDGSVRLSHTAPAALLSSDGPTLLSTAEPDSTGEPESRGTTSSREPRFYCAPEPNHPGTAPLFETRDAAGHWSYSLTARPNVGARQQVATRLNVGARPDARTRENASTRQDGGALQNAGAHPNTPAAQDASVLCHVWTAPVEFPASVRSPDLGTAPLPLQSLR